MTRPIPLEVAHANHESSRCVPPSSRPTRWTLAALAALLSVSACGSAPTMADPCAPHGESHGDHCDCDPGYREQDMRCVPLSDAGPVDSGTSVTDGGGTSTTDGAVSGCGPNGEDHGGHCHCDAGYVEIAGRCVEPPPCVGPDDALEPNDLPSAASDWTMATPRSLYSCNTDEDWFAVPLTPGARVDVMVGFTHASSDIDAYLFAPGADPTHDAPLAAGDSTDDDETLTFTATTAGAHLLLVYGYDHREAPYTLDVTVTAP